MEGLKLLKGTAFGRRVPVQGDLAESRSGRVQTIIVFKQAKEYLYTERASMVIRSRRSSTNGRKWPYLACIEPSLLN